MKRSQPKRLWGEARAKVEREAACRLGHYGGCAGPFEAAHIIGRDRDKFYAGMVDPALVPDPAWHVAPVRIFPACQRHHRLYDAHQLDALSVLTIEEQLQAVIDADGVENMRVRTCPGQYRKTAA